MVFSSIIFLFYFLPITLFLYWHSNRRNLTLLVISLVFYAWGEFDYLYLLILSIAFNYVIGLGLGQEDRRRARAAFAIGIIGNLGVLLYYKYANFIVANINEWRVARHMDIIPWDNIPLPLGISFFTFHSMSYLFDIFRRKSPVERDPLNVALYILMFPQLVAGPIIRFQTIRGEIHNRTHTLDMFSLGIKIFILGLGQKVLVANTVAAPVDKIFALAPEHLSCALAWIGTLCYTLQIYFDFAGYSNMAIGLGLMFGLHFPQNFNYPYISQSITEFWRRWHITLSSWFRDYLYIPLGGNRHGPFRTYFNLVLVFFLCGLWHGASWAFVVWGLYHGFFLVIERVGLGAALDKAPRPLRHVYTLLATFCGWVIFRADTLTQAVQHLKTMFGLGVGAHSPIMPAQYLQANVLIGIAVGVLGSMPVIPWLAAQWKARLQARAEAPGAPLVAGAGEAAGAFYYVAVLLLCVMSLASSAYNPFIYFRF